MSEPDEGRPFRIQQSFTNGLGETMFASTEPLGLLWLIHPDETVTVEFDRRGCLNREPLSFELVFNPTENERGFQLIFNDEAETEPLFWINGEPLMEEDGQLTALSIERLDAARAWPQPPPSKAPPVGASG